MSELKVASLFEFEKVLQGRSNKLFYSKSEVDNVIAELETRLSAIQSDKMQLEDDNALLRRNNAELREATRWRKCSEDLPKDGETVLVLLGRTPKTRGFFLTSLYVAGGWTYGEDPQGCKPTHWFRIPKEPEVK